MLLYLGMFFAIFLLFELIAFLAWFFASIPYKIALNRRHPNVTAIRAMSWLGVLTLGLLWPVALIWAYSDYSPMPHETPAAEPSTPGEDAR